MVINQQLLDAITRVETLNYPVVLTGGFIRDYYLNIESNDYDLSTAAPLDKVAALFDRSTLIYKDDIPLVLRVSYESISFEITRFRKESYDEDHNLMIHYVDTFKEDVLRRDFTINALGYNQEILDYVGGLDDLKHRCLRTVGDPEVRFQEDVSRVLRGIRFASTLNLSIESETQKSMLKHYRQALGQHGAAVELKKIMSGDNFDTIHETFKVMFDEMSDHAFYNVKIKDRSILKSNQTLLIYLYYIVKLPLDNKMYQYFEFTSSDFRYLSTIETVVDRIKDTTTYSDMCLIFIDYQKELMKSIHNNFKHFDYLNKESLDLIESVYDQGYLSIHDLKLKEFDLSDDIAISDKYKMLVFLQKSIIKHKVSNNYESLRRYLDTEYPKR